MNQKSLIKLCLFDEDAILTYPFKDRYNDMPVLRHKSNNKWFGLIFEMEGRTFINLKCNPLDAAILKDEYNFITSAWHMNKTHWIKVDVDICPKKILKNLIKFSFDITK